MTRQYGIDVASYQPESLTSYVRVGAKFVIVKLTQGTGYFNPKAVSQIKSAHSNHIYVHAYHFAVFGHSVSQAKQEAEFFISRAKRLNVSKKRYLVLDWEGLSGNYVQGSKEANTSAILAFMHTVKKAGYKPMLYSGAYLLRNNVDLKKIIKEFGTCVWVASYATSGRIDTPNFNYFPSMDGVAIWQFTDNWRGLNVDGNISLIDLHKESVKTASKVVKKQSDKLSTPALKKDKTTPKIVYAPIINNNSSWMIALRDADGHYTGKYIPTNSRWKVCGEKVIKGEKHYKLGTDKQYAPAKFFKVVK